MLPSHGQFWYQKLEAALEGAVAAEQLYCSADSTVTPLSSTVSYLRSNCSHALKHILIFSAFN